VTIYVASCYYCYCVHKNKETSKFKKLLISKKGNRDRKKLLKQDEDILVLNSITLKIPIQQDEDTGNKSYYI